MVRTKTISVKTAVVFFSGLGLILALILLVPVFLSAGITGECSNCHTMHNSQGGAEMATYGSGQVWSDTTPQPALLRGTCLGCHGQGGTDMIKTINGSPIPQVYHTGATDLASGNFNHIVKVGGGDDRGHNVIALSNVDGVLDGPPGYINQSFHDVAVTDSNLTCAGENGCHGTNRYQGLGSGIPAIKGAHHGNVDGKCDAPTTVAKSYRFLYGVKGLENTTDKWQNLTAGSHNEYYGASTPALLGCGGGETSCHAGPSGSAMPPNNTISEFCGTCHGNFHTLTTGSSSGIGSSASSPFQRHPTDIVIKNTGEYSAAGRVFNPNAPVGRTTVYDAVSSAATTSDVVTCLSCHAAHASNYADMLKWDYSTMNAGGGSNTNGCFACHTEKDT